MGDEVLVSFCNVSSPRLPLLALFNPASGILLPLRLPDPARQFKGITGLAREGPYLYAVAQFRPGEAERLTSRCALLVFSSKSLELVHTYEFRGVADGHSLVWSAGKLYVVSTGTDEIVELEMNGAEVRSERPYLRSAHATRSDVNHLNGLCDSPDGLIMSAFGPRTDSSWASATNGFILNVKRKEMIRHGLQHPHSPFILGPSVVFCESRKTSVGTVAGDRKQLLPGYTRGVCMWGSDICVGTSVGRRTSRSTGKVVENPGVAGIASGGCTISRLRADDFGIISTFETPLAVGEIYDLMTVDDVGLWPVEHRSWGDVSIVYFALYPVGASSPHLLSDPQMGSAPLLFSDEAGARRAATLLNRHEVREFTEKQVLLDVLDGLPGSPSHVALDVRFDDAGGMVPVHFIPLLQFRRSLLSA